MYYQPSIIASTTLQTLQCQTHKSFDIYSAVQWSRLPIIEEEVRKDKYGLGKQYDLPGW